MRIFVHKQSAVCDPRMLSATVLQQSQILIVMILPTVMQSIPLQLSHHLQGGLRMNHKIALPRPLTNIGSSSLLVVFLVLSAS